MGYIIHAPPKETTNHNNDDDSKEQQQQQPSEETTTMIGKKACLDEICSTYMQRCEGHVHFATLPNMYNRTITISSAGKTFSATGWQVGWCIGPEHLIKPIHKLLPYVQFCPSTLMQEALARSLHLADDYFEGHESYYDYLKDVYVQKRNKLVASLKNTGFGVPDYDITPGGGFFIFARISDKIIQSLPQYVLDSITDEHRLDWAFCEWLAKEKGVLCIPSSPFFSNNNVVVDDSDSADRLSDRFIRIAFCKLDETIDIACSIFEGLVSTVDDDDDDFVQMNLEEKNIVA